jgi:oligopeptide transport system permease protein
MAPAIAGVPGAWRQVLRSGRAVIGGGFLLVMILLCAGTLPWTAISQTASRLYFDRQNMQEPWVTPSIPSDGQIAMCLGTDRLGRSVLGRALVGGAISLGIGVMAASIAVVIGVTVGLVAGYAGGWVDNLLMRIVDVLYSLPYVLMVVLLKIAMESGLQKVMPGAATNLVVLFLSIGLVSWLTMARVVRGQVLSLRSQPFIEACRALGLPGWQILLRHLLPNLVGPVIIYATLTIPVAILQESFLSFLGIGIQPPMPTWGSLASEGLPEGLNPINSRPWLLVVPCVLLALTLLSLNFVGDALRDILDPRREQTKV